MILKFHLNDAIPLRQVIKDTIILYTCIYIIYIHMYIMYIHNIYIHR